MNFFAPNGPVEAAFEGSHSGQRTVEGRGSYVAIGEGSAVTGDIEIRGIGSRIVIGRGCILSGYFSIIADHSEIIIGDGTSTIWGSFHVNEPGRIAVGSDCQFGHSAWVSNSDMHPIFDASGARANPAADVEIEDHVWIGLRAIVLKGARARAGSILGAGSVLTGELPARSCAAGSPARVLRSTVRWERNF